MIYLLKFNSLNFQVIYYLKNNVIEKIFCFNYVILFTAGFLTYFIYS